MDLSISPGYGLIAPIVHLSVLSMAFYQAQLPMPVGGTEVRDALASRLQAMGLEVYEEIKGTIGLVASEPPSRGVRSREHVIVHCDWSEHAVNGAVQIECRSDESMARRQTHCRDVFEAVCLRLVEDPAEEKRQAA